MQHSQRIALERIARREASLLTAQIGRNQSRRLIRTAVQLLQARRPPVHRTALRNLLPIPVTETPARALLLQKREPLPPPLLPNQPQKPINHTARSQTWSKSQRIARVKPPKASMSSQKRNASRSSTESKQVKPQMADAEIGRTKRCDRSFFTISLPYLPCHT